MVEVLVESEKETSSAARTELAPRWKVILHNDDVTTFQFVTEILLSLFKKERSVAVNLTYEVHYSGQAIVEITSRERAELYIDQVRSLARPRGYPLTASAEPDR
jgi:ATP-dependent Clp protease adaptor protein ClpS